MSKHFRVRQGGSVKRFHTWPTIGDQTVAAHTWGVLALIFFFDPAPSAILLKRAVYHDLAEYDCGDVPSSAKWASPDLKEVMDATEKVINDLHGFPTDDMLTAEEVEVLKIADLMDMLWYTYEQFQLGNRGLRVVSHRVVDVITKRTWHPNLRPKINEMLTELETLWLATNENEPS